MAKSISVDDPEQMALALDTSSVVSFIFAAAFLSVGVHITNILYNIFLHPLRGFPGPVLWRVTRLRYCYSMVSAKLAFEIKELHDRYGPVVRVAPNEVAFADPRAWRSVMGGGRDNEFHKWVTPLQGIKLNPPQIQAIVDREEHARLRRALAPGFSDRSMRAQEPLVQKHVDHLIVRLREGCDGGTRALNMTEWYPYTTIDIISDMTMGESFACLEKDDMREWSRHVIDLGLVGAVTSSISVFAVLRFITEYTAVPFMKASFHKHFEVVKQMLNRRLAKDTNAPDMVESLISEKNNLSLNYDEVLANVIGLIVAGSETTGTLLCFVTALLLSNPAALAAATKEVRSMFKTEDEIKLSSVSNLRYMIACLNEAMRMFPPEPSGMPRVVPPAGAMICGRFVPGANIVTIQPYGMYHSARNFTDPDRFHPERWLGDPKFTGDACDDVKPFHTGTRDCIGKNLAYVEMRLILARVLFNFDMRSADDSQAWLDKAAPYYLMWKKYPLNVFLEPVA